METFVILAAVAATVIGCVLMAALFGAGRREPLRLPQEQGWADDEAGTVRKLTPDSLRPIDRDAPVLDAKELSASGLNAKGLSARILDAQLQDGRMPEAKLLDSRALDAELNRLVDRSRHAETDQAGRQRQIG